MHVYGVMRSYDDMLVHPIADHLPGSKWERAKEKIIAREAPQGAEGESGRVSGWVSEWVIEWVSERVSGWVGEWVSWER